MGTRQANKRRKVVVPAIDAEAFKFEDVAGLVLEKLLELPGEDLAKLLGHIANRGNIKTAAIEKARTSLPSFSDTDFADNFVFPDTLENNRFERVVTPIYSLPPSVHEIMFEAAWHTQDVYQERQHQRRAAARVRIMDPVCQPSHYYTFPI